MAESSIFYDPFANRKDDNPLNPNFDPLDKFDSKFLKDREAKKNGLRGSDSNNDDESQHEDQNDDFADDYDSPSAPPIDMLDRIQGYELVSFDATHVPPPPPVLDDENDDEGRGPEDRKDLPEGLEGPVQAGPKRDQKIFAVQEMETLLTEEQARSALLSHISHHCCYGSSAAKNMRVKKLDYLPAYHYELQTFTEKRETAWTYSQLKHGYDGVIHSPPSFACGLPPPLPWEIEEEPSQPFKDEVRLVEVPRTESAKTCHRCRGSGGVLCRDCNGKGWCRCLHCHGDGWMSSDTNGHKERCFYCQHSKNGHGHQDCAKCHSKGKVNCQTCEGHGQIRCYIQLSVTWKVQTAEHIVERLELPRDLIRDVSGQVAFEEEGSRVQPVDLENVFANSGSDESQSALIKDASANLVSNHLTTFSLDQKVIRQRHQVRIVPVTRVTYDWKNKLHQYYVYGYENKVYLPTYPQRCCWGCQIA